MKCKTCNKEIIKEWRKDTRTIKIKPLLYCSRNCSNNRGERSKEVRDKISKSLQGRSRKNINDKGYRPVTYIDTNCVVCGSVFSYRAGYKQKTCNKICRYHLYSLNRQNYLKENGNFSTIRESFTYKQIKVEVDSNLEKAGIIYLVDILKAKKIERYKNLLNFWEGESHRTYNPDFFCIVDGSACIVEIKQKWIKTSNHSYNRTIPLKKQALEAFCKDKGYRMLWLDFDSAPELYQIYRNILKNKIDKN